MDVAEPTADDLAASATEIQAAIAEVAETGPMRRDPFRLVLAILSMVVGYLLKTTRRWEHAVADVIAARQPMPPEAMEALIHRIVAASQAGSREGAGAEMKLAARRLVWRLDRRLIGQIALAGTGLFVAGCVLTATALWQASAGPWSAAADIRTDPATGRRYAVVTVWVDESKVTNGRKP